MKIARAYICTVYYQRKVLETDNWHFEGVSKDRSAVEIFYASFYIV
jgi:hypothetical protein